MSISTQQMQPPKAAVDQIIGLYNQGQLEQTISLTEGLAKQYPNALILYDILGAAYMGLKNTKKTIVSYEKALQLNPNHTDAHNNMGMALYDQGRFDEAVESYQKAIELEPKFADAHYNLGNAQKQRGNLRQAIESYKASLALNPGDAEILLNYGNTLKSYGYVDQAIEAYRKALEIDPDLANARANLDNAIAEKSKKNKIIASKLLHNYQRLIPEINFEVPSASEPPEHQIQELIQSYNLGKFEVVLSKAEPLLVLFPKATVVLNIIGSSKACLENYEEALTTFEYALKIKPDDFYVLNNMGNAQKNKGDLNAAIESYKKAIKIKPDYAEVYSNMGVALQNKGDLEAAIDSYKQAIKIKPDFAEAFRNMGLALQDKGELNAAIDSCNQAIKIKPNDTEAYLALGNALQEKGKLGAAVDSYKKAIEIKPDFVQAYSNMGNALRDKGELDAAIESCKQAIKIKPDYAEAHQNLSFAFLNSGRLKEGLDEYEWRWQTVTHLSKKRHFSQPLWDGIASLRNKTILLWGEQGAGDVVMWSSCLSLVASHAEKCILECEEKLVPLITRSFPNIEVKAENKSLDNHRDDFDFHLPMGSLFSRFIPEVSEKTKPDAFLIPDQARVNFWKERLNSLGKGPYFGISWKSPLMTPARLPNYTQISDWAPLFSLPNVIFVNLQSSDFKNDLAKIRDEFGIVVHNFDDLDHFDDLDDVAALCAALDIVVSVSTAVSTLAAGVGTPTKMLHWRQSAWNNILFTPPGPFVDVFERNTWEPWNTVFQSVARDVVDFQVV